MTNIKVIRRFAKGYDIYFDVSLFRPQIKEWKIAKSALTREEVMKYLEPWILDTAHNKIYVDYE